MNASKNIKNVCVPIFQRINIFILLLKNECIKKYVKNVCGSIFAKFLIKCINVCVPIF